MGYTQRRGAQRNAGTDECFVTDVGSARDHLVSDHSASTTVGDTYKLAV
jgi:hypothetical protein